MFLTFIRRYRLTLLRLSVVNLSDGKSVKLCVIRVTNTKTKISDVSQSGSRPKSARASPQHLAYVINRQHCAQRKVPVI